MPTDGPAFQALLAGGMESEDLCRGLLPLISWTTELRPSEWPPYWAPTLLESYYRHLDRGEVKEATGRINQAIEEEFWGNSNRLICLEAAYFSARHENSAVEAREWLTRPRIGFPVERFVELRAEAAVLHAEGNYTASADRARDALQLVRSCERTGWTLLNVTLLDDLAQRAATPGDRRAIGGDDGLRPL
jgi:hypothetical protein